MNQIKRKRRLSPLEASVFGNVIYVLIVLIFKNVFDVFYGDEFNYFLSGLELIVVALFWIGLFTISFKNIFAGEKKRYFAYVFYTMLPIFILTAIMTIVTVFAPGQDTGVVWNQFTFLAAPTIFWYLPFGLIYQMFSGNITIFVHFGIALILTIIFQMIGIVIGRIMGRQYWIETSAEISIDNTNQKKPVRRKKSKSKQREVIGMEGISDEIMNENFVPEKPEVMTEVIIDGQKSGTRKVSKSGEFKKRADAERKVEMNPFQEAVSELEMPEAAEIPVFEELDKIGGNVRISEETLKKHEMAEEEDKSFLMKTSQIRIIDDQDVEEYYKNKKYRVKK